MSIDKPIGRAALRTIITIFSSTSEEVSRGRTLIGGIEQGIRNSDGAVLDRDRAVIDRKMGGARIDKPMGLCNLGLDILKGVALLDDRRVRVIVDPLAAS